MSFSFDGLFWFLLTLLALLTLQRVLHREIQAVFLILTRNPALTMGLFSILFFPGVFLHELSHFLMARLLGVRTGGFSLIPRAMPNGNLQLGYVETAQTDLARDALIGAAPIISGGLVVSYIALSKIDLLPLWDVLRNANFGLFWLGISMLPQVKDFPLWFYLTFVVSSTMMPSESDRHAWLPLGLLIAFLIVLALFAGAGPWMLENVTPWLNSFLRAVALIFGLSALVHAVIIPPAFLLHRALARLSGVDIA
ncbi:MAG TPA: hypothetical protein VMT73_10875 [Anaerolineales bacterium]|nr:hypothetical protein [Anaerolineales bacterium]